MLRIPDAELERLRFRRSAFSARVKHLFKKAGITRPGSCHLFRHACATHMLQAGPTSASSRPSWATKAWKPPSSTPTSRWIIWPKSTPPPIRWSPLKPTPRRPPPRSPTPTTPRRTPAPDPFKILLEPLKRSGPSRLDGSPDAPDTDRAKIVRSFKTWSRPPTRAFQNRVWSAVLILAASTRTNCR